MGYKYYQQEREITDAAFEEDRVGVAAHLDTIKNPQTTKQKDSLTQIQSRTR